MNKDLPVTAWRMNGANLGDIWRPLEVHFRLPLNRWENLPAGILRFKEWTSTMSGGAPVGTVPSLSPTTRGCARELACRLPRRGAIPLTAMPGGMGRGGSGVCLALLQDTIFKDTITQQMHRQLTQTSSDRWNKAPCENARYSTDKYTQTHK